MIFEARNCSTVICHLVEFGEKQGFFHGRIAATNDDDFLATEEETITGGAGGDAVAEQAFFGLQPEQACRGTRGNNQGFGVQLDLSDLKHKGALGQIDVCHVVRVQFRTEAGRLLAKNLHHVGPQNTIGIGCFDFCGQVGLTTGLCLQVSAETSWRVPCKYPQSTRRDPSQQ
jgi:hypothetical protein